MKHAKLLTLTLLVVAALLAGTITAEGRESPDSLYPAPLVTATLTPRPATPEPTRAPRHKVHSAVPHIPTQTAYP